MKSKKATPLDYANANFETIIENAGLSKFRTLTLYLIRSQNLRTLMAYHVIIPKSNKSLEFAPLIELAEKELELFEEEEGGDMNENEFKKFVEEIYEQAIGDISDKDDLSDIDESQKEEIKGVQENANRQG